MDTPGPYRHLITENRQQQNQLGKRSESPPSPTWAVPFRMNVAQSGDKTMIVKSVAEDRNRK
jgi:hypothetical protein